MLEPSPTLLTRFDMIEWDYVLLRRMSLIRGTQRHSPMNHRPGPFLAVEREQSGSASRVMVLSPKADCGATIWVRHGQSVAVDDSHWLGGYATIFFRAFFTSS